MLFVRFEHFPVDEKWEENVWASWLLTQMFCRISWIRVGLRVMREISKRFDVNFNGIPMENDVLNVKISGGVWWICHNYVGFSFGL